MAQGVKNTVLPLLWHEFDHWLAELPHTRMWQKKKKKKSVICGCFLRIRI